MPARVEFKGLKVLVLLNGARDHRPFYSRVGKTLGEAGASVHYALDSHLTDYLDPGIPLPGGQAHYFSEYFRAHYGREDLPEILRGVPTGRIIAPDVDRWRYSRFSKRRDPRYVHTLTACLAQFFEELFARHAFDVILYENVSNAFSYMAFEIGRRHGARFVGFVHSRLPGRMDVLAGNQTHGGHVERLYRQLRRGEARATPEVRAWVRDYLVRLSAPDYMNPRGTSARGPLERYANRSAARRVGALWRYGLRQDDDAFFAFQLTNPFTAHLEQVEKELRRALRAPLVRTIYHQAAPDPAQPYVLYPTHVHPESSTSVDAFGFEDELTNIRGIAAHLPHGMRLVVREHPLAAARQPLHFYEEVRRIPNVDLTGPELAYEPLLRGCLAVVCASSSVGYDALLRGKPVFVLGRPFYSFVPGCTQVVGFEELHDGLANAHLTEVPRADVEHFVTAYYMESVPSMFDVQTQRFRPGAELTALAAIRRRLAVTAARQTARAF